jgi:type III secretion system FlhB-like substrate exporter
MNEPKQEEWLRLCAMAAKEQDPEKLYELVQQINLLLEEREKKLKKTKAPE